MQIEHFLMPAEKQNETFLYASRNTELNTFIMPAEKHNETFI